MSSAFAPRFYVTLKDDFTDRCAESRSAGLFPDLEDPYLLAVGHLTPGRVYPVMTVDDGGRRLTVLDDVGRPWEGLTGLFKFAGD